MFFIMYMLQKIGRPTLTDTGQGRNLVISMRKYKGNCLTAVICNCCGRNLVVEHEIVKEGVARIYAEWGYFSEKDGETHGFDVCEDCYDRIISQFKYPVNVVQKTEML